MVNSIMRNSQIKQNRTTTAAAAAVAAAAAAAFKKIQYSQHQ